MSEKKTIELAEKINKNNKKRSKAMTKHEKYTGTEDVYQCEHCDGWHISDYAIKQLPLLTRIKIKLGLVKI